MYTDDFDPEQRQTHWDEVNRYLGVALQRGVLYFLVVWALGGDVFNAIPSMLDKGLPARALVVALLIWVCIPLLRAFEHNTWALLGKSSEVSE